MVITVDTATQTIIMNALEIVSVLTNVTIFSGVININQRPMPYTDKRPAAYIINLQSENLRYDYYVALFLSKNGKGEYFDPRGGPPEDHRIVEYLNNNCQSGVKYNTNPHIWFLSSAEHCINFVEAKYRKISFFGFLRILRRNHGASSEEERRRKIQKMCRGDTCPE